MSETNGIITAEKVLELLRAWSTPGRWETDFTAWSDWKRADAECRETRAAVRSAPKDAANFTEGSDLASDAFWRRQAKIAEENASTLRAAALVGGGERLAIDNWLRERGLFDIAGELPVLGVGDIGPGADAIRDAAKEMQRVLFAVEKHLAEPAAGSVVSWSKSLTPAQWRRYWNRMEGVKGLMAASTWRDRTKGLSRHPGSTTKSVAFPLSTFAGFDFIDELKPE